MENDAALSRRGFAGVLAGAAAATSVAAQDLPQNTGSSGAGAGTQDLTPGPFSGNLEFHSKPIASKVSTFSPTNVRLVEGPFKDIETANKKFLLSLPADRLLHNFRVNAGLPSSAQPLGGWEAPDCELRGHFVGHYLSACALMYSSTGDAQLKSRGTDLVAQLAACQAKLGGGYLSAFPIELFDRLKQHRKVWAPFYTYHKIMAGMLDMYEHCGDQQALQSAKGMAEWADVWSASIGEVEMQRILNVEFGGMSEVLYNLTAATGEARFAKTGDRFTKKRFLNPLALRRDELAGLHVNTHIPQVIGAARRYELTGDMRFHDVAEFFWYEVTTARAYVTGGTSNGESWHGEPRHLAAELKVSTDTTECCCAYNMLKLTRHLYSWTADPRYFDYYERVFFNHRLGTIRKDSGATMYYLSIVPGAWKTFSTQFDSFWCCTGTGAEEYSKLNDSIYFHDDDGFFVNLFIASDLNWPEKELTVRQKTDFPYQQGSTLLFDTPKPVAMPVHVRIPWWVAPGASVAVNGKILEASPSPGSYFIVQRTWKRGDRIDLQLPMRVHVEAMPDDASMQAILYGPMVLAGELGAQGLGPGKIFGPLGPDMGDSTHQAPEVRVGQDNLLSAVKRSSAGDSLAFELAAGGKRFRLIPLSSVFDQRYSIFWRVA